MRPPHPEPSYPSPGSRERTVIPVQRPAASTTLDNQIVKEVVHPIVAKVRELRPLLVGLTTFRRRLLDQRRQRLLVNHRTTPSSCRLSRPECSREQVHHQTTPAFPS